MGIPSLAAFKKSETMGYNLIFSLSEQIDGQFEFSNDNGTQFVLHFPSI
jgi:two-component sensor histidine kinase